MTVVETVTEILKLRFQGMEDDEIMKKVGCGIDYMRRADSYLLVDGVAMTKAEYREQLVAKGLQFAHHKKPKNDHFTLGGKRYTDMPEMLEPEGSMDWEDD